MIVYLAGGFKSGWQDKVINHLSFKDIQFFDPRTNESDVKSFYPRDIAALKTCDVVFAYLETSNPGGMNMAFELGYAAALGKRIIFVNERTDRYMDMLIAASWRYTADLGEAIAALEGCL
jgi:nucleoside 2-deoxyribosyltransferase